MPNVVAKYFRAGWWPRKLWPVIVAGGFAMVARGDTIVVTTTNLNGPGSFEQALVTANANPGLDTITFNISGTPPFTISPTSALDPITEAVVIDGTTQPGFAGKPVVELNGAASGGTTGLQFNSGASTLRGLAINGFSLGAIVLNSASNSLQGNFIGADVTGLLARGDGSPSYPSIQVNSVGNMIGGTNSGDGNLISGGNGDGLYFYNASNNVVQGNLIGLAISGTNALNNLKNGVVLNNSSGNLIGGPVSAARNIVSGNGASGIYLTGSGTAGNVIQGNRIGTDLSGSNAVSNIAGDGISLIGTPGNIICSNLISGNGSSGVSLQGAGATGNLLLGNFIGTSVNGTTPLGNPNGVTIFSSAGGNFIGGTNAGDGNVISGNLQAGIALTGGATTNFMLGNFIGLTAAGTKALGNGQDGIVINGGTANTIGGVTTSARNHISGNAGNGVDIVLQTDQGNTVLGNYIGLDITGTQPLANAVGVRIQGSSNIIGGTLAGARNVISGNTHQGILIVGSNGNVKGNVIQGNWIGVTPAGTVAMGNGSSTADNNSSGIMLSAASTNLIGGTAAGAANVISGNNGSGVIMAGTAASGNVVQGNFMGTDASGTIRIGNIWEAIYLEQAATNLIGGTTRGAGNIISGNYARGINLSNASWNIIQGNLVGTTANGVNNMGNQYHNVDLQLNSSNNIVGGTAVGAGNRLAFAQGVYCGVRVRTGAANNLISGNSIFSNGALGIDLSPASDSSVQNAAGINAIVSCESDVVSLAANAGQNFPVLSDAYSGASTRVRGSLNATAGTTCTLQFFASPAGDPSGDGEGQIYLGQTNLTLSVSCSSNFTAYLPASVPPGWVVSATATDPNNNTSEFSAWVPVVMNHPPVTMLMTVARPANAILNVPLSDLAANWSDPDGDPVSLTSVNLLTTNAVTLIPVNVTTNNAGAYVITNTAYLSYINGGNQNDQFSYAIADDLGGTNIGFVNILTSNGVTGTNSISGFSFGSDSNLITAFGIPGFSYILERSTNLTTWVDVSTNTAATNGVINTADYFYDLGGAAPSPGFYRLKWQP